MRCTRSGPPTAVPGGAPSCATGMRIPGERNRLNCGKTTGDESLSFAFESKCELESRIAPAQMQLTASLWVGSGVCECSSGAPGSSHRSAQQPNVSARQNSGQATRKKATRTETNAFTEVSFTPETPTNQLYRLFAPRDRGPLPWHAGCHRSALRSVFFHRTRKAHSDQEARATQSRFGGSSGRHNPSTTDAKRLTPKRGESLAVDMVLFNCDCRLPAPKGPRAVATGGVKCRVPLIGFAISVLPSDTEAHSDQEARAPQSRLRGHKGYYVPKLMDRRPPHLLPRSDHDSVVPFGDKRRRRPPQRRASEGRSCTRPNAAP
jgi:hypothetical protein